ncbi:hypothetical protein JXQ70_14770, partial [bacterium]|nr:hypothetical protein [bacterium]
MGRKLLFGLCFLLFAGLVNAGEWVPLTSHDPAPARIEVVSSSLEETILSVSIPGYFREEVELDGTKYEIFSLSSGHNLMEKGCPTLPFEATDVAVANQGTVSYSVGKGKSVTLTVENYLPSKGHFTRNIDPETVPYTFAKVYDTDADYPRSIVQVGEPFILRNVRGVNVSIRPFQYNPIQAKMTITTDFQFSIRTVGRSDKNVLTDDQIVPESKLYQDIYRTRFINYEQNAQRYTAIGEIGNMLIITNDSFYNDMLPLLYWKLQKGIPCKMVTLTTTGSTAANVQAYIQNEYATNGLTFVLLVGDSAEMPSLLGSEESVKSDPTYAFISGSDSYPELFISRFPAQTPTDVQIMVNRIINYEKTPMSGSSGAWYHQAFGIGGDDEGSTGIADWERVDLLKDEMVTPAYNYTVFTEIYHSSATASQVTAAVNNGRGIGVYIGHGSQISWGTTGFDVTDTYALTNTDLVPLVHSVACLVGQFYYSGGDCFAEAWQKCGTPAAPTGAVAHYGSVTNQSWVPPCDAQTETIDLLVSDSFHSIGALCFNGTMGGMDLWPGSEGNTLMQQWHIFGDCSTMIYTDELATLSVSHAGAMPVGQATYDVTVTGVEDALCALYNASTHVLYGSNYTNSSGQTTITLDPVPASVMELTLTVTGFNKMPYFDTVDVIVPSGPWLVHDSHIIDDSTGNDDGIINPGETVNMPVTLENIGADPATGVSATLTTSNTDVTVTDNYATYPDIAVSGTGQSLANHYSFTVSSSAGEGDAIPFSLNWSASGGYADVTGFTEYVCEILTISNISITDVTINSAIIHWTTNIPADSLVTYGTTTPPSMQQSNSTLTTSHSITLTGLTDCTTYYFEVSSTSPNCYILTDDNGGAYYNFTTYMQQVSFFDDMESGTGSWISSGLWHQVTEPTCSPSAYSSSTSWYYGQDSSCNFSTGSTTTGRLYSEAIEIVAGTELHFWYRRDTECGGCCTYDNTSVQISTNGGSSWTTLEEVCDDSDEWVEYAGYDLSTYAGQTINLGFYFDSYDSTANTYTGWMIDDVTISKPAPCVPLAEYSSHIFTDDCPAGGAGDADGILDAGETIVFQIDIANTGSGDLTGVWAELSTSTTGVTVTDAQANYNNIAEGTSGTSLSPHFTVYLAETIACGTTLDFSLTIHTNEGNFTGGSFSETVGEIVPGNFTLIDEDFESAWGTYGDNPPTGWTIEDYGDEGTPTWNANDWYRYSKGGAYSYIARVYYSPLENQDEWLITPAFTIPVGATSVNLEYDHYFRMYSTGEYGYVDFRSTQNPSWTNLVTYSST